MDNLDCEDKIQEFEKKQKVSFKHSFAQPTPNYITIYCFHILLLQEKEAQEKVEHNIM